MKACEMVGVSRRTIYNWIAANKVEYLRTAGGSIRIFVDTLWREPDGTKHPTNHTAAYVRSWCQHPQKSFYTSSITNSA